jgi:hypothetical protein
MVYSTDGGASWSQARTVVASGGADWDPALLIDPYGRMHLFYHLYPQGDPFWEHRSATPTATTSEAAGNFR